MASGICDISARFAWSTKAAAHEHAGDEAGAQAEISEERSAAVE
ncbi:hypothetical protein PYH37_001952 [Sinorhizobium numidicum]|uniref:Uncharacterized protein n=1 Tax=Sinorhizobium numidicum TaxID=680248 RepID=A0ABY8CPC1_9HYPH|nr:hypothetical protein [Sinorhizobium numidicum]WEX74518.1 hypothetical protein PYH37_001952 [Sinorhizobium numidicum]WEX80508.1 hypothetical protein PYH38_001954 [Sinorhizobium numidicum]